jgi:hypothetical protein
VPVGALAAAVAHEIRPPARRTWAYPVRCGLRLPGAPIDMTSCCRMLEREIKYSRVRVPARR